MVRQGLVHLTTYSLSDSKPKQRILDLQHHAVSFAFVFVSPMMVLSLSGLYSSSAYILLKSAC